MKIDVVVPKVKGKRGRKRLSDGKSTTNYSIFLHFTIKISSKNSEHFLSIFADTIL